MTGPTPDWNLTWPQQSVLSVLPFAGERGLTSRQVARLVWPDDPSWDRWTAGRGASRHNGARGATMPLRAGRVLAALERKGIAECDRDPDGPRGGRWTKAWTA